VARSIGPERYAAIRTALQQAFPQATVTDDVVDGVALVLQHGPSGGAAPAAATSTCQPRSSRWPIPTAAGSPCCPRRATTSPISW
jgi:hypothetical protein